MPGKIIMKNNPIIMIININRTIMLTERFLNTFCSLSTTGAKKYAISHETAKGAIITGSINIKKITIPAAIRLIIKIFFLSYAIY
jgi:hypothetical protein